jgi:histidinol-phosphate aminotransferase
MTEQSTAPSTARSAPPGATHLFNGYIGSCVVYALQDVGLVAALQAGPVDLDDFAGRAGLEPARLRATVMTAARLGHLSVSGNICELTEYGHRLCEELCYFTCTIGGYGDLFLNLAGIMRGERRLGVDVPMRLDQVAKGRQQYSRGYELQALGRMLEGIDPGTVVDLASGDGSFLLFAGDRYPTARAFGVDLDANACARARSRLSAAGMDDRAEIIECTIDEVLRQPSAHPELAAADVVTNFALLHHLIATPDGAVGFLRRLRAAFPRASHFLFSDITAMNDEQRLGDIPIFSLAYELFHVFMDIEIRTHEAYLRSFEAAGLRLVRHSGFGQPNDQLYLLAPVR